MKKLLILGLLSAGLSVNAAEMSFITVLSSPVGSFNRLEVVDSAQPASASRVNFCTKVGTSGTVQLQGLDSASLGNLTLASDVVLGRSGSGDYVLNSISLNSGGAVTGSRLLANNVTVSGQGVGKSSNLYGTTLTVAGAKTAKLNVNNGASQITLQHEAADMVWSNEYQTDDACKAGSACAKQYLLKSTIKESAVVDCSDAAYRRNHKQECCPSWPNKNDPVCYRRSYVWKKSLNSVWPGYNYVYLDGARDCTQLDYALGDSRTSVYPIKWDGQGFTNDINRCVNRWEGQECDPDQTKGEYCFVGLSAGSHSNMDDGWIYELRQAYAASTLTWIWPELKSGSTGINGACWWGNIQKWPVLECSGSWVPDGWEAE